MATPNDAVSPTKKPQPIPWTHQETVHLIRAYQEKWYALKRGPLRHNQWEEVAVIVAARCGYDLAYPAKSALQCRHKMEKLRQRHRAEKKNVTATLRPAAWQYNALMEDLECGPLPISALAPFRNDTDSDPDDDGTYRNGNDGDESFVKSKSINCTLGERPVRMRNGERGFLRERSEEERDEVEDRDDDVLALPAEMRAFADRFIGMESLKMEMMKETGRCRLEMEKKRIQMIVDSQRRIVDSIGRAFGSNKRVKITQQI
ncbi:trihelix transcription factor ASIL1 [Vigna radiata var. radiata]|uniref:Trihelix transcription factor ASIL1 n=1 Tax=Vigna radiata var. radiata TaxID=3916 RepID=A0A1S3VA48_VIGRR|nr:trihelix transcription factor ASIL1 [Vigna radiata var. radiata]